MSLDLSALEAMADFKACYAAPNNADWKGRRLSPLVIHALVIIR